MKSIKVVILVLAALLGTPTLAQSTQAIRVEISEDMTRFAFDESKSYDDGRPAHGSGFVTLGYVYQEGTLNGSNGVLEDGSPEFPEQVIGEWICYGYMINDAGHASEGAWVISTQVINLTEEVGGQSIVTTGYEFADDTPIARAIVGGTSTYAEARGQATQVLEGLNVTEGVVLSVELEIVTPEAGTASTTNGAFEPLGGVPVYAWERTN